MNPIMLLNRARRDDLLGFRFHVPSAWAVLVLLVVSCQSIQGDYDVAERAGTVEALEAFLGRHADGPLANRAREQIVALKTEETEVRELEARRLVQADDAEWEGFATVGTIEAYASYCTHYPKGRHVTEAADRWDVIVRRNIAAMMGGDDKQIKSAWELSLVDFSVRDLAAAAGLTSVAGALRGASFSETSLSGSRGISLSSNIVLVSFDLKDDFADVLRRQFGGNDACHYSGSLSAGHEILPDKAEVHSSTNHDAVLTLYRSPDARFRVNLSGFASYSSGEGKPDEAIGSCDAELEGTGYAVLSAEGRIKAFRFHNDKRRVKTESFPR